MFYTGPKNSDCVVLIKRFNVNFAKNIQPIACLRILFMFTANVSSCVLFV